jgi:arsenate reductase
MRKQKVLFLCTHNSARSQMAQAFLQHYAGNRFEAYSAGCMPTDEIRPYAVEAMDEQYPKDLKTYMGKVGFNHSIIV